MAGLAPASRAELGRATVVYGSRRQLDLLDDTVTAQRREWPSPMLTRTADASRRHRTRDVHVVASGDPLLHGVGGTLIRLFGADRVTVLPHVSSVTLACARLGWAVQDTEVISLVTADPHTAVRRGGQAVCCPATAPAPPRWHGCSPTTGRGDSELTVLEQLGGPAERRRDATAREWAADPPDDVDDLNVVAVRYLPDEPVGSRCCPTMRSPTTGRSPSSRCGRSRWPRWRRGRVSCCGMSAPDRAASRSSGAAADRGARAVAFERDEQRRKRIADERGGVRRRRGGEVARSRSRADDGVRPACPRPSAIFIGGGLTQPGLLDACLERLPTGGRLVANAVTVESEAVLAQWYSGVGGELRRFQHYRGEPVGGFTGWRPAMPVTQWSVTKR